MLVRNLDYRIALFQGVDDFSVMLSGFGFLGLHAGADIVPIDHIT